MKTESDTGCPWIHGRDFVSTFLRSTRQFSINHCSQVNRQGAVRVISCLRVCNGLFVEMPSLLSKNEEMKK